MEIQRLQISEQVPLRGHYDVIVVGGGIAGVAAAVAASRQNRSTLLIEKGIQLGGLATAGYVVIYLPLCDGCGNKLSGGISEELLRLSIRCGYDTLPEAWKNGGAQKQGAGRYQTVFNAPAFVLELDEYVQQSGAELLLDTLFTGVVSDGRRVTHVLVENRDGKSAYACDAVVDATGDARVFAAIGAPLLEGENYLTYWGYYTDLAAAAKAVQTQDIFQAVKFFTLGADNKGHGQPAGQQTIKGTSAADVNEFILHSRKLARGMLEQGGIKRTALTGLPCMPQFRTIRRIRGTEALDAANSGKHIDSSVACCGDWQKSGPAYEIPFGSLFDAHVENVLAAGRITACVDQEAWEIARVIPVAASTGEAAGIAAALLGAGSVQKLDAARVQQAMLQGGNPIHLSVY